LKKPFTDNWRLTILSAEATMHDALASLNRSGLRIACFLDAQAVLEGVLTDSDIRKALLGGAQLTDAIRPWMNRSPLVVHQDASTKEIERLSQQYDLHEIPVIDSDGRMTDLYVSSHIVYALPAPEAVVTELPRPSPMLILAGGFGTRLRPSVSDRPKSLALVGDQPILKVILLRAAHFGFREFFISVHYLADQIEEHLKDLAYQGLKIHVVREVQKLGTAGSLGLIKEQVKQPIVVWNSDVLTTLSPEKLLRHHLREAAAITCAVRQCQVSLPYGVVELKNKRVQSIQEKPSIKFMANAGINVVSPETLKSIPVGKRIDMPDLIRAELHAGKRVCSLELKEYWIDIGNPGDYDEAKKAFPIHFPKEDEDEKASAA